MSRLIAILTLLSGGMLFAQTSGLPAPSTSGNATTATNLASYPALCSGAQYSHGISSGSNNCGTPSGGGGGFAGTVTYTSNHTLASGDNGFIVKMNCSSACAVTLPNPQPSSTFLVDVVSTGSAVATLTLGSSMTYNGGALVPVLVTNWLLPIAADSVTATNYVGGILPAATGVLNSRSANYPKNLGTYNGQTLWQQGNFTYQQSSSGALTWVNETGATTPINFGACTAQYAIDSVNGNDSNAGTCASPWASCTNLNSISSGFTTSTTVGFAANTHIRGDCVPGFAQVSAYGVGIRPELDGNAIISAGGISGTAGQPLTYQFNATPEENSGTPSPCYLPFFSQGVQLTYQTSIANVNANAGTFYITCAGSSVTVYFHEYDGSNATSNGYLHELGFYYAPLWWSTSGTCTTPATNAPPTIWQNVWTNSGSYNWSLQAPCGAIVYDALATEGAFHNIYVLPNTTLLDVVADGAYYPTALTASGAPAPIVWNWTPAAGNYLNFVGALINMPSALLTGNGTAVGYTGHNATNPNPLTINTYYSKTFNVPVAFGAGLAGTWNLVGDEAHGAVTQAITPDGSYTSTLNVNGFAGENVATFLEPGASGASYNLTAINSIANNNNGILLSTSAPIASLILTNSFVPYFQITTSSTLGTCSITHNTLAGQTSTGNLYNFPTGCTSLTSNNNLFLNATTTNFNYNGTSYPTIQSWQAAGFTPDANSNPTGIWTNWGNPININFDVGTNDQRGGVTWNVSGGTLTTPASLCYNFNIPYNTQPQVYPTYSGATTTYNAPTWTQSGNLYTGVCFNVNGSPGWVSSNTIEWFILP